MLPGIYKNKRIASINNTVQTNHKSYINSLSISDSNTCSILYASDSATKSHHTCELFTTRTALVDVTNFSHPHSTLIRLFQPFLQFNNKLRVKMRWNGTALIFRVFRIPVMRGYLVYLAVVSLPGIPLKVWAIGSLVN
uniref:Uncharacterized protein n=1 Tax=Glossina austeni TaxID=7395 RepID=A0A1A9VIV5_GLOAU